LTASTVITHTQRFYGNYTGRPVLAVTYSQ